MPILEINFISVLVATIAGFGVGAIWYGVLFGKQWLNAIGKTKDDLTSAVSPMVITFVALFVMAAMLYGVIFHVGSFSLRGGLMTGLMIWLGFVMTTMVINHAFQQAKPMLTLIDGSHFLVVLLVMGAIIGGFGA